MGERLERNLDLLLLAAASTGSRPPSHPCPGSGKHENSQIASRTFAVLPQPGYRLRMRLHRSSDGAGRLWRPLPDRKSSTSWAASKPRRRCRENRAAFLVGRDTRYRRARAPKWSRGSVPSRRARKARQARSLIPKKRSSRSSRSRRISSRRTSSSPSGPHGYPDRYSSRPRPTTLRAIPATGQLEYPRIREIVVPQFALMHRECCCVARGKFGKIDVPYSELAAAQSG